MFANGNGEVFKVYGMISRIFPSDNDVYTACPKCKKKMTEESGGYRCEKGCNEFFETCDFVYMLKAIFMDSGHSVAVTCPREAGEMVTGMPGKEFKSFKETNDLNEIDLYLME